MITGSKVTIAQSELTFHDELVFSLFNTLNLTISTLVVDLMSHQMKINTYFCKVSILGVATLWGDYMVFTAAQQLKV